MLAPVVDLAALRCFGFGDDPGALVQSVLPRVERLSLDGDDEILAWTDEGSGARLVLGSRGADVRWVWPTLWAPTSTRLGGLAVLADDVVSAAVIDDAGAPAARLVLRLEQGRSLTAEALERTWPAAVVATGAVRVFADGAAFAADPISIVGDAATYAAQPPEHFAARGWAWPPRLAAESLDSAAGALPMARLTGTVLSSATRRNDLTGHEFIVARLRTLGLELDLCLPADHPPVPAGVVVAGTVGLVGRLGLEPGDPRQRWVPRPG